MIGGKQAKSQLQVTVFMTKKEFGGEHYYELELSFNLTDNNPVNKEIKQTLLRLRTTLTNKFTDNETKHSKSISDDKNSPMKSSSNLPKAPSGGKVGTVAEVVGFDTIVDLIKKVVVLQDIVQAANSSQEVAEEPLMDSLIKLNTLVQEKENEGKQSEKSPTLPKKSPKQKTTSSHPDTTLF